MINKLPFGIYPGNTLNAFPEENGYNINEPPLAKAYKAYNEWAYMQHTFKTRQGKMAKHIHAGLMLQYAQDAMETETPWERWEIAKDGEEWHTPFGELSFLSHLHYRRKQRTININGFEVPEPLREPPNNRTKYYAVYIPPISFAELWWTGDEDDKDDRYYLDHGLIHLTKEAATLHREALLSFTKVKKR